MNQALTDAQNIPMNENPCLGEFKSQWNEKDNKNKLIRKEIDKFQYDQHNEDAEEVTYPNMLGLGTGQFDIFNMIIGMEFIKKVTYEQKLKGAEGVNHGDTRGDVFLTKGTTSPNSLRGERPWHLQGITRRLVWLEQRAREESSVM